jgi:hypothetical protein
MENVVYILGIWNILWAVGNILLALGNFVYFSPLWNIVLEKSGNPGREIEFGFGTGW